MLRTARRLLATGPPSSTAWEGWEPIVYTTYGLGTVLLVVGLTSKPDTRITEWAKQEAMARIKAAAMGEEIEYGKHYKASIHTFTKEEIGEAPTLD